MVETGRRQRARSRRRRMLATDEELDAFTADACWLAHAFVDAAPAAGQTAAAAWAPSPSARS